MMTRLRAIPPYTAVVGLLVLVAMVYALLHGNPLGVIMAAVLVIFVGVPALLIWALSRRDAARDPERDRQERAAIEALWQRAKREDNQ